MDFTEARDSEWQWHQLGHMQVCTSLQTDNHTSTPPLSFYRPSYQQRQSTEGKHIFIQTSCTFLSIAVLSDFNEKQGSNRPQTPPPCCNLGRYFKRPSCRVPATPPWRMSRELKGADCRSIWRTKLVISTTSLERSKK